MSVCLSNKIPNVYHSLSLTPFIKHLASTNIATWPPRRRTLTASANHNSPLLEALTSRQKEQISLYVDALLEWNQRMNLTAVTDANEVRTRHVEDSLAIISPIYNSYSSHCNSTSSSDSLSVVDIGSGAGLPGLIFAIACPGWKVTLLESMNKRCVFLEHAISVTGLSNVEVLRARAESVGQSVEFREMFDVAVARAVAEMRILAEYCLPLVRVGGLFVAAKGPNPQEEVKNAEKAIKLLGASVLQLCSVESHSPYGQRTAIICLKDRPTSKKYPRDPGTPAKDQVTRRVIGVGEREAGLFFFRGVPQARVLAVDGGKSMELWHKWLGHPSEKVLRKVPCVSISSSLNKDGCDVVFVQNNLEKVFQ